MWREMEACYGTLTVCLLDQNQNLRRLIFMNLIDKICTFHFRVSFGDMGCTAEILLKTIKICLQKVDVQSLKASGGVWEPEC